MKTKTIGIDFKLRRSSRAKLVRIAIYIDRRIVVTAPKAVNLSKIVDIVNSKSSWIIAKLSSFNSREIWHKEINNEYELYKAKAARIIADRIDKYNRIYCLKINKVGIRNQATKWGSCTQKGNLYFNYRIVFLPKDIIDYIVVHELCHLAEFNHSRKFWNLVSKTIPHHRQIEKRLSEYC